MVEGGCLMSTTTTATFGTATAYFFPNSGNKSSERTIEAPDLLPRFGNSKSIIGLDDVLDLLLDFGDKYTQLPDSIKKGFFSMIGTIFSSHDTALLFLFFCMERASTSYMIRKQLPDISESNLYRSLDVLLSLGIIKKAAFVHEKRRTFRPSTVYAIKAYTPEDLCIAIEKDRYARTPVYSEVKRIKQLIIEDYLLARVMKNKEIAFKEIIDIAKKETSNAFNFVDIANLVASELHREGIKVWR